MSSRKSDKTKTLPPNTICNWDGDISFANESKWILE